MYIPKRYGESKNQTCPFCGKTSTTTSKEHVPVCQKHKHESVGLLKCLCGESLDLRASKWGPYGVCMRCGNISWAKILSCNTIKPRTTQTPASGSSEVKPFKIQSETTRSKTKQKQFRKTYNTESEKRMKNGRKEITMTSDEVDFYFG